MWGSRRDTRQEEGERDQYGKERYAEYAMAKTTTTIAVRHVCSIRDHEAMQTIGVSANDCMHGDGWVLLSTVRFDSPAAIEQVHGQWQRTHFVHQRPAVAPVDDRYASR